MRLLIPTTLYCIASALFASSPYSHEVRSCVRLHGALDSGDAVDERLPGLLVARKDLGDGRGDAVLPAIALGKQAELDDGQPSTCGADRLDGRAALGAEVALGVVAARRGRVRWSRASRLTNHKASDPVSMCDSDKNGVERCTYESQRSVGSSCAGIINPKGSKSATATTRACLLGSGNYIRASADDGLERQRVVLDADLDSSAQARSFERHVEV
ncbi:hypothetical protein L1887_54117 [Cichorium endivia]|nr:hypothetical protein L1887_54117 [Cichorium endivia]